MCTDPLHMLSLRLRLMVDLLRNIELFLKDVFPYLIDWIDWID